MHTLTTLNFSIGSETRAAPARALAKGGTRVKSWVRILDLGPS